MLPGGAMRTEASAEAAELELSLRGLPPPEPSTDPEQAGIVHDIARREVTTDAAELAAAIAASLESAVPPPYIASLESETPQPQPPRGAFSLNAAMVQRRDGDAAAASRSPPRPLFENAMTDLPMVGVCCVHTMFIGNRRGSSYPFSSNLH